MTHNPFANPIVGKEMIINPSFEELRKLASHEEKTTQFGSASYVSRIRNRSAKFTHIVYKDATPEQEKAILAVQEWMKEQTLIRIDRKMCINPNFTLHCRHYTTTKYARLPFAWGQTLFDLEPEKIEEKPDITVVQLPDWHQRLMLVDPKSQTTYLLGSDYIGEAKKAGLRMAMYIAKCRGLLGLHAGSKEIYFKKDGEIVRKGAIFFGLSGTGKTTLTCHHHGLSGEEGVVIRQDDVIMLDDKMHCIGTENNFYIKTEGLEPIGQPLLYNAAISPKAVLENIWVGDDGTVDFLQYQYTSNGRAVVHRADMDYTDDNIDLDRADIVVFITRRKDIVPPRRPSHPRTGWSLLHAGRIHRNLRWRPHQSGTVSSCGGNQPLHGRRPCGRRQHLHEIPPQ